MSDWVDDFLEDFNRLESILHERISSEKTFLSKKHLWAFGFTLTGHDKLEPNASTNADRIEAIRKLHDAGFKTFASIEPIIDFDSSFRMIQEVVDYCDIVKIGLMSGKKYSTFECKEFCNRVVKYFNHWEWNTKVYFKDSLLKQAEINREDLPAYCVGRDYNLFKT